MTIIQPLRNFSGVRAGEIFFKYSSDYCSLFGNNLEFIINSCESKRSLIGIESALAHLQLVTPSPPIGDGFTLSLSQCREHGDENFAGYLRGVNVLFLEVDADTQRS